MALIFKPRTLISSSNVDTMLLKSLLPETRLTFINSGNFAPNYINDSIHHSLLQTVPGNGSPVFTLSASNQIFSIIQNTDIIAEFREINDVPNFTVLGTNYATNYTLLPGSPLPQKAFVAQDYNAGSPSQFAGFGYSSGILNYQIPTRSAIHAFYAANTANTSVEWMRIQENNGLAQVGIGTNIINSNIALQVNGNVAINGNLTLTGNLNAFIDTSTFVQINSNTGRISSNVMPNKILYLNASNMIDTSVLPVSYNFQYLKSQKNIGIGTKVPLQKLHVQGTTTITDRLGINNIYPSSSLHVIQSSGSIPTSIFENNSGGDILQSYISGSPAVVFSGTHPGVGIGTSIVQMQNTLEVNGNGVFKGSLACSSLSINSLTTQNFNINDPIFGSIFQLTNVTYQDQTTGFAIKCMVPLQCYGGTSTHEAIAADYISSASSGTVHILNSKLQVDYDLLLNAPPIVASDIRLKDDILPIENALDKLEKIRGYTYKYKDTGEKCAGVIAQELIKILPEAVKLNSETDMYGVKYDAIIALLIEAIHELRKNK